MGPREPEMLNSVQREAPQHSSPVRIGESKISLNFPTKQIHPRHVWKEGQNPRAWRSSRQNRRNTASFPGCRWDLQAG